MKLRYWKSAIGYINNNDNNNNVIVFEQQCEIVVTVYWTETKYIVYLSFVYNTANFERTKPKQVSLGFLFFFT